MVFPIMNPQITQIAQIELLLCALRLNTLPHVGFLPTAYCLLPTAYCLLRIILPDTADQTPDRRAGASDPDRVPPSRDRESLPREIFAAHPMPQPSCPSCRMRKRRCRAPAPRPAGTSSPD